MDDYWRDETLDIVIPTVRELDFFDEWGDFFEEHNLIIINDNPDHTVEVPSRIDHEVYTREDINSDLGEDSWIISEGDSSARCYGFLKAENRLVYTVDDDCFPAKRPDGKLTNPVRQHRENLESAAHPDFFNTMYDQRFVGGFPYERRKGVETAISHGLWLNEPDFGAPGQMTDPNWRNTKYVDIVQTIPSGTMFPMCGMNLAFDRELIGPAMYFGLMGENQPWSRHGDMWAGWMAKKICDHLGMGVKSGKPYVWHDKESGWRSNLRREYNGIFWENKIISQVEQFSFSDDADTVEECYRELAVMVENDLVELHSYFEKAAEAMRIWLELWEEHA